MTTQDTEARRQYLASLIYGKSDAEIHQGFDTMGGPEKVLEPVFAGMRDAFMPDRNNGKNAVIQYDVTTGGKTYAYQLHIKDGACTAMAASTQPASVTIAAQLPDFLKLVSGKLNGVQAFFQGKIKLTGDVMLAQTMQGWFLKN